MENRFNRDYSFSYSYDPDPNRHPRPEQDDMATVRFLLQGTESLIRNTQNNRYDSGEQSRFYRDGEREDRSSKSSFIGIFPFLIKISAYGLFAIILILISLGEFGVFYKLVMPKLHSSNVLYFDYTGTGAANHVSARNLYSVPNDFATTTKTDTGTAHFGVDDEGKDDDICSENLDTTSTTDTMSCSPKKPLDELRSKEDYQTSRRSMMTAPVAAVDLFSNHNSWGHYHPDVVPLPKQEKHILAKGAPHYIEVLLDLPESELNLEKIGMFSVLVELHASSISLPNLNETDNYNGTTTATDTPTSTTLLASSIRTTRIPHESHWISVVRKFVCIIPYVLGAIPESRRVVIPSYRFFVESEAFPLRYVTVRLVMSPENQRRGEAVEVGQGILQIGEEMRGLQLVLKEWFFTCLVVGTIFLVVFQSVFLLVLQSLWELRRHRLQEREQEGIILEDDVSGDLGLNGFDDEAGGNENGDGQDESSVEGFQDTRSEHQRQRQHNTSYDIDDEPGQWEDLPEPDLGSRSTTSNEVDDGNGTQPTADRPGAPTEELQHVIPED